MSSLENFLSIKDEEDIIQAIRDAESKTSGEIRVHIEKNYTGDAYNHAIEVFHFLKMDNTKFSNAVLIYIAVDKKSFVIYGDKGIHDKVKDAFWNSVKDKIAYHFKTGHFKEGIIEGVKEIGTTLSQYFPWKYGDYNELENTISKS